MRQLLFCLLLLCLPALADSPPADKWASELKRFETADAASAPAVGETLFAGSSSFRLWKIQDSFPGLKLVNRGFGGSTIADNIKYCDRLHLPLKPKQIVFYAGDNDLANGTSPVQVAVDFQTYVKTVRTALPECRLFFVAIKPSPSRWKLFAKQQEANKLVREFCEKEKGLVFLDIVPPMLGADGQPRQELFKPDRLHMLDAGYVIWQKIIAGALAK